MLSPKKIETDFAIKKIDIGITGEYICLLNWRDARILQVHSGERIEVYPSDAPSRGIVCVLNVLEKNADDGIEGEVELKTQEIGLYTNAFERLNLDEGERVSVKPLTRPASFDAVKEKFENGTRMTDEQYMATIQDIVDNKYPSSLTTYFVLACAVHQPDDEETASLTRALVQTGQVLKFDAPIVADKHCIGGIPGNRTTPIVVAIMTSIGVPIPNTFTRSITSPAGTADTLETYLNVKLTLPQMQRMVEKVGGCLVWGGAIDMAPADDIIIRVEHPLDIDSESQMIASILAKKIAAGNTHLLLDIPMGPQAKVKTREAAEHLKGRFENVSQKLGLNTKVVITDGSAPVGDGIGPLLEMVDILKVLREEADAPVDLRERSLFLAGQLMEFIGKAEPGEGYERAKEILERGDALRAFEEIRKFQGAVEMAPLSETFVEIKARMDGTITGFHNRTIVKAAKMAGAPLDPTAGVYLEKHVGETVMKGETLYRIYSSSPTRLETARTFVEEQGGGMEIGMPAGTKTEVHLTIDTPRSLVA